MESDLETYLNEHGKGASPCPAEFIAKTPDTHCFQDCSIDECCDIRVCGNTGKNGGQRLWHDLNPSVLQSLASRK